MSEDPVNTTLTKPTKAKGPPLGSKNAFKHGYYSLKAKLNCSDLDKRTSEYRALHEKENELITSLGGDVSPQQRIIIMDTVKHLLYAANLDRYLLQLKSLVRKGKVHGVLTERTRIGAHIRENLKALGLERRQKELSLQDYLNERYGGDDTDELGNSSVTEQGTEDKQ